MVSRLSKYPFTIILTNQLNLCVADTAIEPLRHIHSIANLRMDSVRDMAEQHLDNASQYLFITLL